MEPICIGEYVFKPSLIEYYRLETVTEDQTYIITVFLKDGGSIRIGIEDKDELERITDDLGRVLTEDN